MDWSVDQINELTRLWAEGHLTGEIGKRMGLTKNQVIGKAHRLGLDSRPSPIKWRDGKTPTAAQIRARKATLRRLSRKLARSKVIKLPKRRHDPMSFAHLPLSATAKCQYIEGEPLPEDSCKCLKPAIEGRPYCHEHMARCVTVLPSKAQKQAA